MNQPSTLKERILQYARYIWARNRSTSGLNSPAMPSCATVKTPSGLRSFWSFPEPGWGWNGRSPSTFSM